MYIIIVCAIREVRKLQTEELHPPKESKWLASTEGLGGLIWPFFRVAAAANPVKFRANTVLDSYLPRNVGKFWQPARERQRPPFGRNRKGTALSLICNISMLSRAQTFRQMALPRSRYM